MYDILLKKRARNMMYVCIAALLAAVLMIGCIPRQNGTDGPAQETKAPAATSETKAPAAASETKAPAKPGKGGAVEIYAVKTTLREVFSEDPSKWSEGYGRYTELTAEGDVPETLSRVLAEVNARAKESVETRGSISYIVNVTRADSVLFSVLETETENRSCSFRSAVYDTQSGNLLMIEDFVQDPASLPENLRGASAWTADYLGLRFYSGGEEAVHVSVPYTSLDGPMAGAAAGTPESFIAQIEKDTDYALPHDTRLIRVEKAPDSSGNEAYRIVIRDSKGEKAWWLEYADDASAYYVFRAQGKYYFYRLQETMDQAFVYNFESPDGGYDRFANQNAQCFDSFLHEFGLAVPYDPDCVHMRERSRKYMDPKSGLSTSFVPHGHYAFRPEPGRGRTWLHFALIDDTLALDSHNVGVRLLHELNAKALDDAGNETGDILIPAGEVLRFLRVNGESELYYYMSKQYNMYHSGARDYLYDCALTDGKEIRFATRYETNLYVDGMYLNRIAEPVALAGAQNDPAQEGPKEHYVEIGGKKYKLIMDLSNRTESGEEIDFGGDIWWQVENYVGTFASEGGKAKLVISEDGAVTFDYDGRQFTGKLPEKRYYREYAAVGMTAGYESRTFYIIVEDNLPDHDPSFTRIRFYSEGLPATNEPSKVPPIEVDLIRDGIAE